MESTVRQGPQINDLTPISRAHSLGERGLQEQKALAGGLFVGRVGGDEGVGGAGR